MSSLEGKLVFDNDDLANKENKRRHFVSKDKDNKLELYPLTSVLETNKDNPTIKTTPPLPKESKVVLEAGKTVDKNHQNENRTVVNKNELFNKIAKRKEHEL